MYPIDSNRKLSLREIADHWSGEMKPRRSFSQVFDHLCRAWWRGEFGNSGRPCRADLLRALYQNYGDRIAFVAPGLATPPRLEELSCGGVEIIRPYLVPLPNDQPQTWNDTNCIPSFKAIAEDWRADQFQLLEPILALIELNANQFFDVVEKSGYHRPGFWSRPTPLPVPTAPGSNPTPRKRGREPVERDRVVREMIIDLNNGYYTIDTSKDEKEEVLAKRYRVSRDTARKARNLVLTNFRQKATSDN